MGFNLKVTCIKLELEREAKWLHLWQGKNPGSAAVGDTLKRAQGTWRRRRGASSRHGFGMEDGLLRSWIKSGKASHNDDKNICASIYWTIAVN